MTDFRARFLERVTEVARAADPDVVVLVEEEESMVVLVPAQRGAVIALEVLPEDDHVSARVGPGCRIGLPIDDVEDVETVVEMVRGIIEGRLAVTGTGRDGQELRPDGYLLEYDSGSLSAPATMDGAHHVLRVPGWGPVR